MTHDSRVSRAEAKRRYDEARAASIRALLSVLPEDGPHREAIDAFLIAADALRRSAGPREAYLEAALRQITQKLGRYDRDPLRHCGNVVDEQATIAQNAIDGRWENPDGSPAVRAVPDTAAPTLSVQCPRCAEFFEVEVEP